MRRGGLVVAAALAGTTTLLSPATGSAAKATRTLSIAGAPCPVEGELLDALRGVLDETTIERVEGPADLVVDASDDEVRVTAFGTTRAFSGTCSERARLVSAYLALALEPPSVTAPPAPDPPSAPTPPPEPPAPHPASAPPAPRVRAVEVRVSLAGGVLGAPGTAEHGGAIAPSFALRGALSHGLLRASVGATTTLSATMPTRGPDVALSRLALDASLGAAVPLGRVTLGGEVGPLLGRTTIEATGIDNAEPAAARADLGLRLGALVDVVLAKPLSLTGTFETQIVPGGASLALRREGTIGELPALYLGASVGLTVRVR